MHSAIVAAAREAQICNNPLVPAQNGPLRPLHGTRKPLHNRYSSACMCEHRTPAQGRQALCTALAVDEEGRPSAASGPRRGPDPGRCHPPPITGAAWPPRCAPSGLRVERSSCSSSTRRCRSRSHVRADGAPAPMRRLVTLAMTPSRRFRCSGSIGEPSCRQKSLTTTRFPASSCTHPPLFAASAAGYWPFSRASI